MNVIKVKFIRDGEPKGQAYTYYSENDLELGELVEISDGKKGCVVEINVPPAEIEKFGDKAKTIKGVWVEPEPQLTVEPENQLAIEEPKAFDNLIIIKQLPVIEEHLKALSEEVEQKTQTAMSLICTEDTVKEIKKVRAELNKQFTSLEEQRKAVRDAVIKPYNDFQSVYDTFIGNKFKSADVKLKGKIDEVESGLKSEKAKELLKYFNEYVQSKNIDFLQIADMKINVTLSESSKSLKSKVAEFVDKVSDDLALIETQEFKAEIFVEYKKTLNCSQAITAVASRHEAIEKQKKADEEAAIKRKEREEKEKARIAEIERIKAEHETNIPEPIEAPTPITTVKPVRASEPKIELFTLSFKVKGTKEKLKELKEFLATGGYEYE